MEEEGLKVNAYNSKVMVLGGEEESVCEVSVEGRKLEYVSEGKYSGFVLDEGRKMLLVLSDS